MKTIIFIHGMYMNAKSWENWVTYFENLGYKCEVPSWPFHDGEPAELRENIPEGLGQLKLQEVVDFYADYIQGLLLTDKLVLIGHSMGGLAAQILVQRELASAAVCISSAPPKGISSLNFHFLRSNFPHINPLKGDAPCVMTVPRFHYTFCNTMSMEDTQVSYDRYVVHESRNVPRGGTTSSAQVDFKRPHAPLLFIAGEKDHLIPAALNTKNAKKYTDKQSVVEFKEFKGRTHFICGQDGWQEVVSYANQWLTKTLA